MNNTLQTLKELETRMQELANEIYNTIYNFTDDEWEEYSIELESTESALMALETTLERFEFGRALRN